MKYDKLNEKILEMRSEIISSIQDIIKINSIKSEPEDGAPYGAGARQALDFALNLGKAFGFKTGNCDNRVGWIEYGEGDEMVGVLGHLDVVPLGDGWIYPAFGGEIHDGKLYGRGVLDDKGPVIGAIYALKAIRDLGIPIDRRIRVMFGTDEECGSSCVKHYVESGEEMPTVGFTPDAEYPLIFCEKGTTNVILGGEIKDKGSIEVISFSGGTAPNVVTPKCTLVVKGSIKVNEASGITVTRKNGETAVEAIGLSAHGSTPALGKNAAVMLANAVKENNFGGDFQHMIDFILKYLSDETNGKALGINYEDEETGETTVNLGMLNYDGRKMTFTLDIRYPKNAVPEDIKANISKKAKECGLSIEKLWQVPILYISKESELVKKLMNVYRAQTGDLSAKPLAIGGGTYAKAFPNMVAFGPMLPGEPEVIHQPNECADIEKLMKSFQITAAAMLELAQK